MTTKVAAVEEALSVCFHQQRVCVVRGVIHQVWRYAKRPHFEGFARRVGGNCLRQDSSASKWCRSVKEPGSALAQPDRYRWQGERQQTIMIEVRVAQDYTKEIMIGLRKTRHGRKTVACSL